MLSYNINVDSATWVSSVHGNDLMLFLERIGKDLSKCLMTAQPCVRLSYSPRRCRAGERHCPPDNWRKTYKAAARETGKSCVQMYETTCLPVTPSAAVRRRERTRKGYARPVRLLRCQRLCRRPRRAGAGTTKRVQEIGKRLPQPVSNTGDGSITQGTVLCVIL